ncbi:hypothetical protein JW711_02195 [Candidatus Woesearchaeota archaeon]|nr:hypothetical protein [Candidatus Woesearchaeota archaeon]
MVRMIELFKNKSKRQLLILTIVSLLFFPSALALRSGFSPMDRAVEMIANVFNLRSLQRSTYVQEGFLKFMIFIVVFAVTFQVLQKIGKGYSHIFERKTAGIVSFAFSMIGVFMMPTDWLLATGGLITAIMSSLVFLLVFIGGAYVAVFKLKPSDDKSLGWLMNLMGLFLLILLMFMLSMWADATHLPLILLLNKDWIKRIMG